MTIIKSHYRAPVPHLGENIDAYVLDEVDGEKVSGKPKCVLSKRGAAAAIGLKSASGIVFTRSLLSKGIGSLMSENLRKKLENPLIFNYIPSGSESAHNIVHGYETSTFIDVLKLLMQARREKVLTKSQLFLAERAELMLVSLANTTLDSIIYQESGYWRTVEGQRISEILDKYLQANARKWAKTFPDEFWIKLIKIKGYPSYYAVHRPAFIGHWINDIVYDRLLPDARKKLNELNPRLPTGRRKNTHHQHTTDDYGLPELKAHLIKVEAYMDAAANDTQFMRLLNRGAPRFGDTYEMPLEDTY